MIGFTFWGDSISVNKCYSQTRYGRRFMTDEGKTFKDDIGWAAREALNKMDKHVDELAFLTGKWRVDIYYFFKHKNSDTDGPTKLVIDALQGIFYKNDNQVVEYFCRKNVDKKDPRIEVHVKLLD